MNPTWKAAIGVILIFILGWFGGALTTLIIAHHKMIVLERNPQATTRLLERLTTRGLNLDDGQKAKLHDLLLKNVRERMELQRQIQPQVAAFNRQTMDAINALLTPGQQQKFQDNLLLVKTRFGRNPLYTGPEESEATPAPETAGAGTNAAAASPPAH